MCKELTKMIESHFLEKAARPSLEIYEIGIGTGTVGELLVEAGFANIYGIEPNKAMKKIAEKKGVYSCIKQRFSGTGELESEFKGKFDLALGAGVFVKNHVPPEGFEELLEAVKPGGVVAFPVREDEWTELGYKAKAENMEKEGKWKLFHRVEKDIWKKSWIEKQFIFSLYLKL